LSAAGLVAALAHEGRAAALPPSLLAAGLRAGAPPATGSVSAQVVALAEATLKTMAVAKARGVVVAVLLGVLALVGTCLCFPSRNAPAVHAGKAESRAEPFAPAHAPAQLPEVTRVWSGVFETGTVVLQ